MYIPQEQLKNALKLLQPEKVLVIYGPRRCGKTTLINKICEQAKEKILLLNGEDITVREYLESQSIEKLKSFVGNHQLLIIDEAQKIKNIGLNLKLIVDHIKNIKVIATGSSSFDLAKNIGEPLTGRKFTLHMFPLAQLEIAGTEKTHETKAKLESRLIYGSYPEVVTHQDNQQREIYLKEIISSYLYKDILELDGVRYADKLVRLLQLLAFQIGKETSYHELGTQLSMSKNTVERYLDLLEKSFVIYKLRALSRNARKEISKSPRYYFHDLGIRNALINNFNPLKLRNDVGDLWENYIISERIKKQEYTHIASNNFFWRTYDQKEIDFIEERAGKLFAYEIKWNKKEIRAPKMWTELYPDAAFTVIHSEHYLEFIE